MVVHKGPARRCRCQPHPSRCAAIPAYGGVLPVCGRVAEALLQGRLSCALLARPSRSPCWMSIGRVVQGRIQAQARDYGNGVGQALTGGKQFERSVAAVGHTNQHTLGQPLTDLRDHLTRPVGALFVALAELLMAAFGGRQHGQKGQCPDTLRPRNGGEQHQTQPTQAAGRDEERTRGAHRVAVDAFGLDLGPTPARAMVVEAEHDGRIGWNEGVEEQAQQDAAGGVGGRRCAGGIWHRGGCPESAPEPGQGEVTATEHIFGHLFHARRLTPRATGCEARLHGL